MSADPHLSEFPLFPLGMVALPGEAVPLHIFEERYRTMIGVCLSEEREFGIVWLSDDELADTACACRVEEVLETLEDGRMNIVARGTRVVVIEERLGHLPYPAGRVSVRADVEEVTDDELAESARSSYRDLVRRATDRELDPGGLDDLDAYDMVATVEFGMEAKQGMLELASENDRLGLALRLFRAAVKRLDFVDRAQTRAKSNGKVRFG